VDKQLAAFGVCAPHEREWADGQADVEAEAAGERRRDIHRVRLPYARRDQELADLPARNEHADRAPSGSGAAEGQAEGTPRGDREGEAAGRGEPSEGERGPAVGGGVRADLRPLGSRPGPAQ